MRKQLLVLTFPLVLLLSATAFATTLSGKITASKEFIEQLDELRRESEKNAARGYWNEPNGVRPIAPIRFDLSSDIGVALFREGAPEPKADPVLSLNVYTGGLEKNVVVVRPKSRIKFILKSPYDHELYAPGKHDFKPQQQGSNSFRPVDFYSAGVFEVKCKLFPHFQGWIVATPATYVPKVKSDGSFTLEDVEEGKYQLKVFFKGNWIAIKELEVSGKKQEVAVVLKSAEPEKEKKNTSKKVAPESPQKAAKEKGDEKAGAAKKGNSKKEEVKQ